MTSALVRGFAKKKKQNLKEQRIESPNNAENLNCTRVFAMSGYDPSLYASTGSWAGMPYENSAYGAPPVGGYAMPGYMSTPSYGPAPQPPRGQPVYASFRPTGPAVPFSRPYEGPAPVDLYRSGGYLPPRGYGPPPMYEDPRMMMAGPPPGQPPPQKVFGVRFDPVFTMGASCHMVTRKDQRTIRTCSSGCIAN